MEPADYLDSSRLAADILVILLCLGCALYLWRAWRRTGSPGLMWLWFGFVWSIGLSVVILLDAASLDVRSLLRVPMFLFYFIGLARLLRATETYYPPRSRKNLRALRALHTKLLNGGKDEQGR